MGGIHARWDYDPEQLRHSELFSALLDDDLRFVSTRTGLFQLRSGGRLFSPGELAERFYIVIEGSIRVFRPREDGGTDEMAVFTQGDALGDFDFARRASYDACAVAREDSVLIAFPALGLDMDALAKERPDAVSRILLRSLAMIASRLRSTQKLISENAPWVQELRRRSFEDPGTGLWNRAFLEEEIPREIHAPMAMIFIKPDRFKTLVDTRGHAAGDEAMVRIASVLKSAVRRFGRGWALRLKSNETALILPRCDASEAAAVVRSTAKALASLAPVPATDELPPFVFSVTVVYALWPADGGGWKELLADAYAALIEAWSVGGDRLLRYVPPIPEELA